MGQDERSDNVPEPERLQMLFTGASARRVLCPLLLLARIATRYCQDRYSDLRDDPDVIRRLLELDAEYILPGKSWLENAVWNDDLAFLNRVDAI